MQYYWIEENKATSLEQFFNADKVYPSIVIINGDLKSYGRLIRFYTPQSIHEFSQAVIDKKWHLTPFDFEKIMIKSQQQQLTSSQQNQEPHEFIIACDCVFIVLLVFTISLLIAEKLTNCYLYTKLLP